MVGLDDGEFNNGEQNVKSSYFSLTYLVSPVGVIQTSLGYNEAFVQKKRAEVNNESSLERQGL